MSDIFISYSRENSDFVRKLVQAFEAVERDVWIDFEDIPFASDWWKEVVAGVEASSAGICILSPTFVESQVCSLEIAQLIQNRKKIVPIVFSRLDDEQTNRLPQVVRDLNWIFFDDESKFEEAFKSLLETLDTDLEASKEHTRLLVRAGEWNRRGRGESLLARGEELAGFLPMLNDADLTDTQEAFLEASLKQAQMRQRYWRFVFGFLGGLLAMGYFTLATWRGDILQPIPILLAIAIGEVSGLFTGILAVFANDVPLTFRRFIPSSLLLPLQVVVCLLAGMLTWVVYQWIFLNLSIGLTWAAFFGGLGLALGFVIHALLKPPAPVTFILTVVGIYLPIFLLNSNANVYATSGWDNPLIYFDNADSVISVGLPLALLLALGTNAQMIYQWLFGADELTSYFNRKTRIFATRD